MSKNKLDMNTSVTENRPLVSIYTCVYNRAHTIHRVFESVKKIDYPNIEHIIVNDGSTDNVKELIFKYKEEVSFPVKYYEKENGGKHTALNIAWDVSCGYFLIQLDSDDKLLPNSISFLVDKYYAIPEEVRDQYWCVHGRFVDQHGNFVGDKYPDGINESHWTRSRETAAKCSGDKLGLQVRKYLAQYRFPEVKGAWHIPENIIWKQINQKYGTWYTNEILGINYRGEGNNLGAKKTTRKQFASSAYYRKWKMMNTDLYGKSFKDAIYYSLYFFITTKEYRKNNRYLEGLKNYRVLLSLLAPFMFMISPIIRLIKEIR